MFCEECGKEINDKWRKCPFCGNAVSKKIEEKEIQDVVIDVQVEKVEELAAKEVQPNSSKFMKKYNKFRAFRLKLIVIALIAVVLSSVVEVFFGTEELIEVTEDAEDFSWESGIYWTDTSEGFGRISITKSTEGTNLAFIEMGTDEYVDLMRLIEGIQIDDKTVVATWNEAVFTIVWDTETTFTITREGSCTDANDLADMDYLTDGQQYTLEGTGEETEDVEEDTRDFTNINADDYTTQELLEIYKEITPITDANTSSIVGRTYVNSVDESMLQVVEVTGSTVILLTSYVYTDAFDSTKELVAINSSSFENGWQTFSVSDDGLIIEVVMFTETYGEETLEYILMDEAYDKDTAYAAPDTSLFETSIFTNTYYNETYNLRLKIVEGTYNREGLTGIVIEVTNLNYDDDSYTLSLVISDSATAKDADGRFLILSDDASALRYYNIGTALEYPNEVVYYAE